MNKFLTVLMFTAGFSSCVFTTKNEEPETNASYDEALGEMVATDQAFSDSSASLGMKKAFLQFAADEAVLLRPGYMPIVEGDVVKFLTSQEDTSFTMTWTPKGGQISKSYDLGYTYGVYQVQLKAVDSVLTGTYVSIWQKQNDGKWKFVLDTGNPGASDIVQ
ncbi:MAG: hypothetical protein HEQ40_07370 [Lacibacter sp.]